ncbi:MAG: FadR/GntR family transcriptional regulator [Solirubrobacteraceae bacterium]
MSTIPNSRVHPQSAAYGQELARRVLERCGEPGYAPEGRLPTERSLAAEFGVTRTMIRHALGLLEARGRISREVGRGTFLRLPGGRDIGSLPAVRPLEPDVSEVSPADVMAARLLVEPQVLPLVVAWATQRDFDELARCLDGGAAAQSYEEFEGWDFALHHAIVNASRNQLLVSMYTLVEEGRKGEIWGNLKRRRDSRERRAVYQAQHVELVGALRNRETEHAVRVMNTHLAQVQANLLESTTLRDAGDAPPAGVVTGPV